MTNAKSAEGTSEPRTSSRGRVLFADDDSMVLESTSAALSLAGFEVTAVATAQAAFEALERETPDVLLVDIDMPGNQNLEFLRTLEKGKPFLSYVILTGRPSVDTAVGAVRLGVVDYMMKPPDIDELVACLDAAVHRGRVLRSLDDAAALAVELSRRLGSLSRVIRRGPGPRFVETSSTPDEAASADPLHNLAPEQLAKLTPREREVLRGLARGHSPQKIGESMQLSTNTVRNHLKSIFVKLGVNSQVALLSKLTLRRPR